MGLQRVGHDLSDRAQFVFGQKFMAFDQGSFSVNKAQDYRAAGGR